MFQNKITFNSTFNTTIIICLIVLIVFVIAWIYFQNGKKEEGFQNLDQIIGGSDDNYHLKKLVQTKLTDQFGLLVWDNYSFLGETQNCNLIENGNQCPIGIWEPYLDDGYNSIGQVITKSHQNPRYEMVLDPRQPKTPEIDNRTSLKTLLVSGATLKYPIDYKKVVSFGTDAITNRLDTREKLMKLEEKINFEDYYPSLVKYFSKNDTELGFKITQYFTDLKTYFTEKFQTNATFSSQKNLTLTNLSQLGGKYFKDIDFPYTTHTLILSTTSDDVFPMLSGINYLNSTQAQLKDRSKYFIDLTSYENPDIRKQKSFRIESSNKFKAVNDQLFESFWKSYDLSLRTKITKKLQEKGQLKEISGNISDIKTILEQFFQKVFYLIVCPAGMQCLINHGMKQTIFGSPSEDDYFISVGYPAYGLEKLSIKSITFQIHPDYFKYSLDNSFKTLQDLVLQTKIISKKEATGQYHKITVWQPQTEEGYIALGYCVTNGIEKPKNTAMITLPKNCVKAFSRRAWLPEDKVWEVIVEQVKYSFWRNPYLGTLVVSVNDKLPDQIPVSQGQSKWFCNDIIPCIKECSYVDQLINADGNAKKLCKAHKKVDKENDLFKKDFTDAHWEETKQLRNMVAERKDYLGDLVARIKKTLREEEVYQELTKSNNRFQFKNDVEKQRALSDQLVDKLLNEKGINVDVVSPGGIAKLKKLLGVLFEKKYETETPICDDCPMCPAPDLEGLVQLKDLSSCYGCIEHLVSDLIGELTSAGQEIPDELKNLQTQINTGQL